MNRLIRSVAGWRFEWVLVGLVILLQAHIPFSQADVLLNWYSTDDAFYYFKVAQNITEGHGITFDGVHWTNGFHPLWMVVCIPVFALARFDLILPLRVLTVILILLNAGTGLLVFRFASRWIHRYGAGLIALVWAFYPEIHGITAQKGIEAGINAFFVVLLLEQLASVDAREEERIGFGELVKLGLIASLALFSRLDNIFVVICGGIWLVFRRNNLSNYMLGYMLAGVVSIFSSFFLRLGFGREFAPFLPALYWMLVLGTAIKIICFFAFGLFNPPRSRSLRSVLLALAGATATSSILVGGVMLALGAMGIVPTFPRLVLGIDFGLTLLLGGAIRAAALVFERSQRAYQPPLAVLRENLPDWLRKGLGYFIPVAALLGGYMVWNAVTFGTPMPVSGQVKHWWGKIPDTIYGQPADSFAELFGFGNHGEGGSWWLVLEPATRLADAFSPGKEGASGWILTVFSVLVLAGLLYLILLDWPRFGRNANAAVWLPLLVGCVFQDLYYGGTLYANTRFWYWINHMLAMLFLWGFALDNLFERLERKHVWRKAVRAGSLLAGLVLMISFFNKVSLGYYPFYEGNQGAYYRPEAAQVMELTEPGSTIGMTGGGAVAYFVQDRTVVNLDGLISSYEYFLSMRGGTAREYIAAMGLDYVYGNAYIVTSSNPYYTTLKGRLDLIQPVMDMSLFRYVVR